MLGTAISLTEGFAQARIEYTNYVVKNIRAELEANPPCGRRTPEIWDQAFGSMIMRQLFEDMLPPNGQQQVVIIHSVYAKVLTIFQALNQRMPGMNLPAQDIPFLSMGCTIY